MTELDMATAKPGTATPFGALKQVDAGLLSVGYAEAGPADGPVVLLLHGWPSDTDASAYAGKFPGKYEYLTISGGVGHHLPREAPRAFAEAVIDVDGY